MTNNTRTQKAEAPADFFTMHASEARSLDDTENWQHLRAVLWYSLKTLAYEEKSRHKTPMKFQEFVKYMGDHESMLHYKGEHAKKIVRAFLGWAMRVHDGFLSEEWGEFGVEDGWVTLLPEDRLFKPKKPFLQSVDHNFYASSPSYATATYVWDNSVFNNTSSTGSTTSSSNWIICNDTSTTSSSSYTVYNTGRYCVLTS